MYPDDYLTGPTGATIYLVFDARKPPFNNAKMRQAMALAVDQDTLVSRLSQGVVQPAMGGIVPPAIPGHVPGIAAPYDPELARHKAAEAGYPAGKNLPPLELLVSPGHNLGNVFGAFTEQWEEHLGVVVEITQIDFYSVVERLKNRPAPLMVMGWSADYPDPDNYLRAGGWLDYGGWRHAEFEALVDGARRVLDRRQRMAMYRQAERLLVEEAPVVPISYGYYHMLVKPWVVTRPVNVAGFIVKDVVLEVH